MSDKKTTSTSNTTQSSTGTTTPNVPDWLLQPAQTLAGSLGNLVAAGPGAMTPTESALQKQATTSAAGLTTSPQFGQATDMLTGNAPVQGQSLLDGLQNYYNPFEAAVIDPQLANYDQQAGMTRAAQSAKEASTGAFRGSRAGVAEGQTEGQLAMGRSTLLGGLLNDAYGQATTLSGADADRRQAAATGNADRNVTSAGLLASIGAQSGAQALANEQAQATQGQAQTNIDNTIGQYPISQQAELEGLFQGLDPALFTGQNITSNGTSNTNGTSTTSGGTLDALAKIAQAAAMATAASDRRLKRNIIKIGERADGLALYAFRYLWSRAVHIGVMAQEVLKVKPWAVQMMPCGYYAVDYGKL